MYERETFNPTKLLTEQLPEGVVVPVLRGVESLLPEPVLETVSALAWDITKSPAGPETSRIFILAGNALNLLMFDEEGSSSIHTFPKHAITAVQAAPGTARDVNTNEPINTFTVVVSIDAGRHYASKEGGLVNATEIISTAPPVVSVTPHLAEFGKALGLWLAS